MLWRNPFFLLVKVTEVAALRFLLKLYDLQLYALSRPAQLTKLSFVNDEFSESGGPSYFFPGGIEKPGRKILLSMTQTYLPI